MTARADSDFIEVVGNRGTYLHDVSCKAAQKAVWGYDKDADTIAQEESNGFRYRNFHSCIKRDGEKWISVIRSAAQRRDARVAHEQRRDLLIDAAVAVVAAEVMTTMVGEMTDEEDKLFAEYTAQIMSGDFTPRRVRDLREVAVKPYQYR